MKKREISILLAGFLLFMIPMQIQATVSLPDIVSAGQLNLNRNITESVDVVTGMDMAQVDFSKVNRSGELAIDSIQDALGEPVGFANLLSVEKTAEDYKLAYERGKNANWGSIGSLDMQLAFLWDELQGYKSVISTHAGYMATVLLGSFSRKSWKSWLNIRYSDFERLTAVAALKLRPFQQKGVYKAGVLWYSEGSTSAVFHYV